MPSSRTLAILLAGSTLLAAGCSSSTPNSPTGSVSKQNFQPAKACDVLTKEIASSAMGMEVDTPSSNETDNDASQIHVSTCSYSTKTTNIQEIATMTLLIREAADPQETLTAFNGAKAQGKEMLGVEPETVSGMGEAAYWMGGKLNQLNVLVGNKWYILGMYKRSGDTRDTVTQAMKKLIGQNG